MLLLTPPTAAEECDPAPLMGARTPANFSSPYYPEEYPNNHDSCTTTILAAPGQIVQIEFDDFEMEWHYACRYDYVEVRLS